MTLAELETGAMATIDSVDSQAPGVVRLMVLGLVEGTPLKFRATAIGGDPLEIEVFGCALSVRKEQARHFHVKPR